MQTFREVALDWYAHKVEGVLSDNHASRIFSRLQRFILPAIGNKPINEIAPPEILAFLRSIEAAGKIETAHRTLQITSQVFRYAIAIGIGTQDPCSALRGALVPGRRNHFPTITDPKEIGQLLRAIDALVGAPIAQNALRFLAYTFVRPGELRRAEWSEIDMEKQEWKIPAEK